MKASSRATQPSTNVTQSSELVTQTSGLLYRRPPVCFGSEIFRASDSSALCRLEVRDTVPMHREKSAFPVRQSQIANRKSAMHRWLSTIFSPRARSLVTLFLVFVSFSLHAADTLNSQISTLNLKAAESLALTNHPRISIAELRSLIAKETVRETRSPYFPTISGNVTAASVEAENTRIAAGGLNNPVIFERTALGIVASQLITDFGRTANLVQSALLRAKAESENEAATRALLILQVDGAYFGLLQAQSVLRVADQTVKTRKALFDQVSALASNKLKSELDASFARVAYDEAQLLLSRATNNLQVASARLSALLGSRDEIAFQLTEETVPTNSPPGSSEVVAMALANRPELHRLRFEREGASKFAKAERALHYPTISALGTIGIIPIHDSHMRDDYAAAGVNFSVPIFNGFLYSARGREAQLRYRASEETLRDEENNVVRDARIAVLDLNNAIERLRLTASLLENARQSLTLAQARYNVGSTSIVELSQAQLNETSAEIAAATARYELLTQYSILDFQTGHRPMESK